MTSIIQDDNVEANQQQYDGTTTDKTNLTYEECLAKLDAMSNIVKQRIEQHVQVDAIIGDLLAIEASLLSDCDEDSLYHLEAKLGEVMDLIATKKRNSGSLTDRTPREQRELHELARLFHEHGDVERPTYAVTDGETPSFTPEPTMVTTPEPRAPIPQRAFDSLRRIPASVINMRILEVKATRAESRSLNEDVSAFHDKIWELETLFRYKVGMLLASPLLKVVAWWDDGFWDTRLMSNTGQTFREVDHDIPGVALYREYSNSHDRIVSKNVEIILVVGKKPDEGGFLRRWKGKYGREGKSLWVFSRAALPQAVEQRRGGGDE